MDSTPTISAPLRIEPKIEEVVRARIAASTAASARVRIRRRWRACSRKARTVAAPVRLLTRLWVWAPSAVRSAA